MLGTLPFLIAVVPIPAHVVTYLAPGRFPANPEALWIPLTSDVERTIAALASWVGLTCVATCQAHWWSARRDNHRFAHSLVAFTLAIAFIGAIHHFLAIWALFGLWPPETAHEHMFLPFVNPTHMATLIVLALPATLLSGRRNWTGSVAVGARWAAPVVLVLLLIATESVAAIGVTALLAASAMVTRRHYKGLAYIAIAVLVIPLLVDLRAGITDRTSHWLDALSALRAHWFAGTGPGAYEPGVSPFRTDLHHVTWTHAHNMPLQYLVETGVVGVFTIALIVKRSHSMKWPTGTTRALSLGLLGVAVMSLVDFAIALPAIAMLCAMTGSVVYSNLSTRPKTIPGTAFWATAALVTLVAALVLGRASVLQSRIIDFRTSPTESAAAAVLVLAPWDGEVSVWLAGNDTTAIRSSLLRHQNDYRAQMAGAVKLRRLEKPILATSAALLASRSAPWDYRPHVLLARIQGPTRQAAAIASWERAFERGAPTAHLSEALALQPEGLVWIHAVRNANASVSMKLAQILRHRGDIPVALLALQQAASISPKRHQNDPNLARFRWQIGDRTGALAWLDEALGRNETSMTLLSLLTVLHIENQTPLLAVARVEMGAKTHPVLWSRVLQLETAIHGPEFAMTHYDRLLMTGYREPTLQLQAARLHLAMGQLPECVLLIESNDLRQHETLGKEATALLRTCRP